MKYSLVVLPGDGVGPEVMAEGIKILNVIGQRFGHDFVLEHRLIGGAAIEKEGTVLSDETVQRCLQSDAVLLAAVGDPRYDDPKAPVHPEDGLLALRKALGVFANLRPVRVSPSLVDATPFKPEVIRGTDFIFVRELTGGVYFAQPKGQWQKPEGRLATDSMTYSEAEIKRIVRVGFELARARRKNLVSVDKANVLQSSRLWRQIVVETAPSYPEVTVQHVLVDACAMKLIQAPTSFDVIVTENLFGDILSDEAAMLAGSMGMLPSASLAGIPVPGQCVFGLYEPIHGSAPTIAYQDIVNPIATILSVAMMLQYSLALDKESEIIRKAVEKVLDSGYATTEIMAAGKKKVGTKQMGDLIAAEVAG